MNLNALIENKEDGNQSWASILSFIHHRFVDYIADQFGYRVTIRTNEPGTSSVLGAHITVRSEPGPGIAENIKFHQSRSLDAAQLSEGIFTEASAAHSRDFPRPPYDTTTEIQTEINSRCHIKFHTAGVSKLSHLIELPSITFAALFIG